MSAVAPAAVLIASGPEPLGRPMELAELLGAERASSLSSALLAEAERWAGEVAPGRVHGLTAAGEPLAGATARLLAEHDGPLLVIWPVLARFRPEHAAGALGDLRAGADLVIGPLIDGGLYLLGSTRPLEELVTATDDQWQGAEAMTAALAGAAEARLEVGILRAERALRQATDVRAALVDPTTPERIRAILR